MFPDSVARYEKMAKIQRNRDTYAGWADAVDSERKSADSGNAKRVRAAN